jgi:hypothetical protein
MPLRPIEIECASFADIDREIHAIVGNSDSRWMFRGHRNASWRLQARIERFVEHLESENG